MIKNVTMITMSKQDFIHNYIPSNCEYVNHVQHFKDREDVVKTMLMAVSKVSTPYYFFCDDDDPVPLVVPTPTEPKGILYGDFLSVYQGIERNRVMPMWTVDGHLRDPFLIHKAVCSTELTLAISKHVPTHDILYEYLYHFFLADCYGFDYNTDYKYIWQKKNTGLHVKTLSIIGATRDWIYKNRATVRSKLGLS